MCNEDCLNCMENCFPEGAPEDYDSDEVCHACGKPFEDFSDLGCEFCDVRTTSSLTKGKDD
jgi:hypothetical protein